MDVRNVLHFVCMLFLTTDLWPNIGNDFFPQNCKKLDTAKKPVLNDLIVSISCQLFFYDKMTKFDMKVYYLRREHQRNNTVKIIEPTCSWHFIRRACFLKTHEGTMKPVSIDRYFSINSPIVL